MRGLRRSQSFLGELEFGYLSLHAVRNDTSQARNTYLQGKVFEYGHMDKRAS